MDQKNLETLARLKEKLKEQPPALETYDFSAAAKNQQSCDSLPQQDPKVYDPSAPDAEVVIKVKKKAKKKRKRGKGKPPAGIYDPAKSDHPQDRISKIKAEELQPKPKRADWIKAHCTICRAEFVYLPEWVPAPVLCKGCRNERKGTYKTSKTGRTEYRNISLVPGGAPGSGKRR